MFLSDSDVVLAGSKRCLLVRLPPVRWLTVDPFGCFTDNPQENSTPFSHISLNHD